MSDDYPNRLVAVINAKDAQIEKMRREHASRISQQDAELDRVRREVEEANAKIAKTRDLISWAQSDLIAEARKAAFIEAAEIAEDRMPVVQCMSVEPIVAACMDIAAALRAKAEETNR